MIRILRARMGLLQIVLFDKPSMDISAAVRRRDRRNFFDQTAYTRLQIAVHNNVPIHNNVSMPAGILRATPCQSLFFSLCFNALH